MGETQTLAWIIKSNEAFDMALFLNAISDNDFYRNHYQGIRERYSSILGEKGMELADRSINSVSMSALCQLLYQFKAETVDDIIRIIAEIADGDFSEEHTSPILEHVLQNKVLLTSCFTQIKESKVYENWRGNIRPFIDDIASQLRETMDSLYPLHDIQRAVSRFLGEGFDAAPYEIYLATYIKPIAFQLSRHAMVTHQGPPGYMPIPKQIASLCIHESLHGFSHSAEVQEEQDKLRARNGNFNDKYLDLKNNWHCGPEESFVVGAEAYITDILGIRSENECIYYLDNLNGGMPLSFAIYKKLKEERPDQKKNWCGYGNWLVQDFRWAHLSF